jgi:hypothetical protein
MANGRHPGRQHAGLGSCNGRRSHNAKRGKQLNVRLLQHGASGGLHNGRHGRLLGKRVVVAHGFSLLGCQV